MVIKNRQTRTRAGTQSASILGLGFMVAIAAITFAPAGQAQQKQDRVPESSPESPIRIETDEYGLEWCIIGDPDNIEFPCHWQTGAFAGSGSVPYVYRITRTELSVHDYFDFVVAYAPYYDGNPTFVDLTGLFIWGRRVGDELEFWIEDGCENLPTTISLRNAARYCNWLHNGKIEEEWAFETGCYDASTFTQNPDGSYNDDYTRLPGARYWIPNLDEWLKAGYYDPDRYGPGSPGWWIHPDSSDEPLRIGLPHWAESPLTAPETNGHMFFDYSGAVLSSGLFPHVQSPWALLDVSGGTSEIAFPWHFGSSFMDIEQLVNWADEAGTHRGAQIIDDPTNGAFWGFRMAAFERHLRRVP